jgi:hypothetical protein
MTVPKLVVAGGQGASGQLARTMAPPPDMGKKYTHGPAEWLTKSIYCRNHMKIKMINILILMSCVSDT